ncbi:unnamed protein product [Owenia fusiformis]|uniref:DnaJ homolog subfamily C member 22 n=1 Tax=Owenia fusiformis TaxID=6347 RepID=A0A8J1YB19_OWEFU|nr:unnamed protein product [Owenia fusiformis]
MGKSIIITYILWFLGGYFGLHHFYLRRDRHAFVWYATWGGVFGIGWLRDLLKIPEYVQAVNQDNEYMSELTQIMRIKRRSSFSTLRFAGELILGYLFGFCFRLAFPEELFSKESIFRIPLEFIVPLAIAIGVHTVANIGHDKCSMKWPLIGAYITFPILLYGAEYMLYTVLASAIAANWKGREWRRTYPEKSHVCKRFLILALCCTLYTSTWMSMFYNNVYVTNEMGEKIRVKDALKHFFNSPAWKQTKESLHDVWEYYQQHGWEKMYEKIVEQLDPLGEENAYKVLGLERGADQKEIRRRYKDLARELHPDKVKDPKEKEAAQEKFMEIQQAYETLSDLKERRSRKSGKHKYAESRTEF